MMLNHIRYFIKIVETGSFTEAAARCYISQSSVSQGINALEAELGIPLFVRRPRCNSLTEAGRYFYQHVRWAVWRIDRLKEELANFPQRTGAEYMPCADSLPEGLITKLNALETEYPGVRIVVYMTAFNNYCAGRTGSGGQKLKYKSLGSFAIEKKRAGVKQPGKKCSAQLPSALRGKAVE